MKIIKATIEELNLKLNKPFGYFSVTLDHLPYALVKIHTDKEIIGMGEASIAWDVTGETQVGAIGVFQYIKKYLENNVFNTLEDVRQIMDGINSHIADNSSLKCAIEIALLDVLGQKENKTIYELFNVKNKGQFKAQKVFSFSDVKGDLIENIGNALNEGTDLIKLKVGQEIENEVEIIRNIVQKYPKAKLIFDVNQGWINSKIALCNIAKLEKFNKNIAWIEQPVLAKDYNSFIRIKKSTNILIMADESCHDLTDLENLYYRKCIDLVNIKLAKTGGFFEAIKMIKFCESKKIKYMLGDMISSSLGTSANLNFAHLGNFVSLDLTFEDRIVDDPFESIKVEGNNFYVPEKPGLGIKYKS